MVLVKSAHWFQRKVDLKILWQTCTTRCQTLYIIISTSIYDLVLLDVCHFNHHHQLIVTQILRIYRDTRAYILDLASRNFHTALCVFMENHHFFRQINAFTKNITKELISPKYLNVIVWSCFIVLFYTLDCKSFRKMLLSRNFFVKKVSE